MPSLTLQLKEIHEEGFHLAKAIASSDLGLRGDEVTIRQGLDLTADFFRIGKGVRAEGHVHGPVLYECVRCLDKFEQRIDFSFSVIFTEHGRESQQSVNADVEREDEAGEMEAFSIVNGQLELGNMIREHMILTVPMKPICHPGCLGLCQTCGHNLNQGDCKCQEIKEASPFSSLRKLMESSLHFRN